MKKKPTKKVPAVVEQGRELNLDAIVEMLEEASGSIIAVACAMRMHRDHLKATEQKAVEMIRRVAKQAGTTPARLMESALQKAA